MAGSILGYDEPEDWGLARSEIPEVWKPTINEVVGDQTFGSWVTDTFKTVAGSMVAVKLAEYANGSATQSSTGIDGQRSGESGGAMGSGINPMFVLMGAAALVALVLVLKK